MASEDAAELDRQTEARLKEIEEQVKEQLLTSNRQPMEGLREFYATGSESSHFLEGCAYLEQYYDGFRAIRGDGNCYYRAFLFELIEHLFSLPPKDAESLRILEWVKTVSWQQVIAAGYSEFTVEMFYDELVEVLQDVVVDRKKTVDDWHAQLNQENAVSDYCTWYLRVLTATYLKSDPDRFLPFMEVQHLDMAMYCSREVEPMGKECEMVSVLALAEAFQVQVSVEYLDGRPLVQDKLACHTFGPETATVRLRFLYRPGHYDCLYAK